MTFELFSVCSYYAEWCYDHSHMNQVQTNVFFYLEYKPRSGIPGSYIKFMFSFIRSYNTKLFQSDYTILHSHQQSMRVLVSPHSHQYLVMVSLFDYSHSSRCVVSTHCGLIYISLGTAWCWFFFFWCWMFSPVY